MKETEHKRHRLADLLLVLLAALFCWCALQGTLDLNPQGIGMDSDLQNYAQIRDSLLQQCEDGSRGMPRGLCP